MHMSASKDIERAGKDEISTTIPVLKQPETLDAAWLRDLCKQAGADDVGFVQFDRPELDTDREDIREAAPWTRTLISFVVRMNRENIRSPMRSLANVEFHASDDQVTETSRKIVRTLEQQGVRAMHSAFGFPMEAGRWPGKIWVVSHKRVAQAAGLGKIGIHRNVIHPKFGSFIFLGTVLIDRQVAEYGDRIDFDPCLNCKLCVAACPTGAIKPDGEFDFSACYTHNYREFLGGFGDWVEQVADSKNALDYRKKVRDSETVSMWQSLSFQSNYKAAYCLSVCPAGEDVIGPYLQDKKSFKSEIMKPLTTKKETIYVVPDSDAEDYVAKRFPHKTVKRVGNVIRPRTIDSFLAGLPLVFQRRKSSGLNATYHFSFIGAERADATVVIRDRKIEVTENHIGRPDLHITADAADMARFSREGKESRLGAPHAKDSPQGLTEIVGRIRKVFPLVIDRQAANGCRRTRTILRSRQRQRVAQIRQNGKIGRIDFHALSEILNRGFDIILRQAILTARVIRNRQILPVLRIGPKGLIASLQQRDRVVEVIVGQLRQALGKAQLGHLPLRNLIVGIQIIRLRIVGSRLNVLTLLGEVCGHSHVQPGYFFS